MFGCDSHVFARVRVRGWHDGSSLDRMTVDARRTLQLALLLAAVRVGEERACLGVTRMCVHVYMYVNGMMVHHWTE